eukprot:403349340
MKSSSTNNKQQKQGKPRTDSHDSQLKATQKQQKKSEQIDTTSGNRKNSNGSQGDKNTKSQAKSGSGSSSAVLFEPARPVIKDREEREKQELQMELEIAQNDSKKLLKKRNMAERELLEDDDKKIKKQADEELESEDEEDSDDNQEDEDDENEDDEEENSEDELEDQDFEILKDIVEGQVNDEEEEEYDDEEEEELYDNDEQNDLEESKGDGQSQAVDDDDLGEDEDEEEIVDLFKPDKKNGKIIDIDFELVIPNECYYHTVRALLTNYLDGEEQESFDMSGLADQVVNCISIGSIVASSIDPNPEEDPQYQHLSEDEFQKVVNKLNSQRDVYGFTTVLSLTKRQKQNQCFQQIIKYAVEKAEKYCNDKQRQIVENILLKKNCGLLLNERMVNLPFQEVAPQLHSSIPEDIKFTKKQDDIEDPREFDYEYLLAITRYTVDNMDLKKNKNQTQQEQPKTGNTKMFYKPEDELFSRHAEVQFSYKTTFRETMQDGTKKNVVGAGQGAPEIHYKMIYLIKYSEYEKRIREIPKFFQE